MAVEPISITASIGSTLKFLGSAYLYAKNVANASDQAQQVADQLLATKALLKSLKHTLKAVQRPRHFVQQWAPTARSIISAINSTIKQLNEKLGNDAKRSSGVVKLGFWGKMTWPLEREETLALQSQLYGSMQMLSMLQNALMMGTAEAVQQSARQAEETMTSVDFSCFSATADTVSYAPSDPEAQDDLDTIVADDSVSVRQSNRQPLIRWQLAGLTQKSPSNSNSGFFSTTSLTLAFNSVLIHNLPSDGGGPIRGYIMEETIDLLLVGNSSIVYIKERDRNYAQTFTFNLKDGKWPKVVTTSDQCTEALYVEKKSGLEAWLRTATKIEPGKPVKTPLSEALTTLWHIWKPWYDAGCPSAVPRPPGK